MAVKPSPGNLTIGTKIQGWGPPFANPITADEPSWDGLRRFPIKVLIAAVKALPVAGSAKAGWTPSALSAVSTLAPKTPVARLSRRPAMSRTTGLNASALGEVLGRQ